MIVLTPPTSAKRTVEPFTALLGTGSHKGRVFAVNVLGHVVRLDAQDGYPRKLLDLPYALSAFDAGDFTVQVPGPPGQHAFEFSRTEPYPAGYDFATRDAGALPVGLWDAFARVEVASAPGAPHLVGRRGLYAGNVGAAHWILADDGRATFAAERQPTGWQAGALPVGTVLRCRFALAGSFDGFSNAENAVRVRLFEAEGDLYLLVTVGMRVVTGYSQAIPPSVVVRLSYDDVADALEIVEWNELRIEGQRAMFYQVVDTVDELTGRLDMTFVRGALSQERSTSLNGSDALLYGTAEFLDAQTVRLARATYNQAGAAYLPSRVSLARPWRFRAELRLTDPSSRIADGFSFMLQNQALGTVGPVGGLIGIPQIPGVVAIVYDVFQNPWNPNGMPRLSILRGGLTAGDYPLYVADAQLTPLVGDWFTLEAEWTGASLLVRLNGALQLSADLDIPGIIGAEAWLSVTASTGAMYANHDLRGWRLESGGALARSVEHMDIYLPTLGVRYDGPVHEPSDIVRYDARSILVPGGAVSFTAGEPYAAIKGVSFDRSTGLAAITFALYSPDRRPLNVRMRAAFRSSHPQDSTEVPFSPSTLIGEVEGLASGDDVGGVEHVVYHDVAKQFGPREGFVQYELTPFDSATATKGACSDIEVDLWVQGRVAGCNQTASSITVDDVPVATVQLDASPSCPTCYNLGVVTPGAVLVKTGKLETLRQAVLRVCSDQLYQTNPACAGEPVLSGASMWLMPSGTTDRTSTICEAWAAAGTSTTFGVCDLMQPPGSEVVLAVPPCYPPGQSPATGG